MNEHSIKNFKICKKKREKNLTKENLLQMSREELIEIIIKLEAHNVQLQSIIQKKNHPASNEPIRKQKEFNFKKVAKRHVFLKFYYFGWDYKGYVVQEDSNNTIEDYLFKALEKCCLIENRKSSNYHRCGRTDKGVSAFSQVVSIDLRSKLSNPNENNIDQELPYCSMLNKLLPENIKCYAWCHIPLTASARFDCSLRNYKYYFPKGNLNIELMQEGAKYLVGTHDFRNFCKMDVGNGIMGYEREIQFVDIKRSISNAEDIPGYEMYEFEICGKSFLWHQVRCILSVLLLVGKKLEKPEIVNCLLDVKQNPTKPQYSLASHLPLNLHDVTYKDIPTKWIIDKENLNKILRTLQNQWTSYAIKPFLKRSTMIKDVINSLKTLQTDSEVIINTQDDFLLEGVKSKVYKPLLTRMKCESLENKIHHYIKRRKLEIVAEENKPS